MKGNLVLNEKLVESFLNEDKHSYKIPKNWIWVHLGKICDVNMGQSPKGEYTTDEPNNVPLVGGPADMGDLYPNSHRYTVKPTKLSEKGELIVSVRATLGKTNFADRRYCLGRGVAGIRSKIIDVRLLKYFFDVIKPYLYSVSTGTTFQQVSKKDIEGISIPLPPQNEQIRIVDKIEQLLSKIDEAKRLIEEAKETFELRRAAILDKAFRGELTRKWREENKNIEDAESLYVKIKESQSIRRKVSKEINIKDLRYSIPSTWKWVRLGDVFTITSGGTPKRTIPEYYEGNIPWIKTGEIKWNAINESEEQITPEAVANSSAKLLPPNTVLVAMYGQGLTRGRAAILSVEATCNQAVCALLPNDYIAPEFIFYYFMEGYQRFRQVAKGGNQENLSVSLISDFIFPLPPLEEQRVIITTLQNIFKKESKIKDVIKINTDEIKQSILSKAFRGELGTNDPTEESAIELLKEVLQEQVK
ncbi:restriction endonuclease subunit S [Heyndrickxia coagulans]|uniref:restriction endonuclease subunit S n=1 Tax=Heyndrickxia coagulans TaxID=1398 RepID=UPI001A940439|nr:restriction endonuclease subunit S [Heyndrickxia coagulans]